MSITEKELPGLDCGVCGFRTCAELAGRLEGRPQLLKRCIHLSQDTLHPQTHSAAEPLPCAPAMPCVCSGQSTETAQPWRDSLGREFDFYLEHFPEDPGPREIILPHNPMLTRELEIREGDLLIGRPLGMSCGCPVTHCGVALNVDTRTGVILWCVTGPLQPRQQGCKDLGYYSAEGYEGLISQARCEVRIGMRYFFQPRRCMLQWRHSGLVNYLNRTPDGLQVRLEGLWIG
ncbi:Fe-S cluster protein [bacterium]|nr:Fe-S cluster protein [bacterium]